MLATGEQNMNKNITMYKNILVSDPYLNFHWKIWIKKEYKTLQCNTQAFIYRFYKKKSFKFLDLCYSISIKL